jgi:hypothetical protein
MKVKTQSINKYCAFFDFMFVGINNYFIFFIILKGKKKLTQEIITLIFFLNYLGGSSTSAFFGLNTFFQAHFETFKTFNPYSHFL